MGCLHNEENMNQTKSIYVVHVYIQYICFMFASSCKRSITVHSYFVSRTVLASPTPILF